MSDKIIETSLDVFDWFDWFEKQNSKIDIWITDPPYPFDNKNGSGRHSYSNGIDGMYTRLGWNDLDTVFERMMDNSSEGARAYVFCNRDGLFETKSRLEKAGWVFRNILIWDKKNMGMGYHWRNKAEFILYVSKGKPSCYVKSKGNIFSYKKPPRSAKGALVEQSAKPFDIWADILNYGAIDGDVCADPFSGSNPMKKAINGFPNLRAKINIAYTNCLV